MASTYLQRTFSSNKSEKFTMSMFGSNDQEVMEVNASSYGFLWSDPY